MNFGSVAYGILAYALGNMMLIPLNTIFMSGFDGPVMLASLIVAVSFSILHEVIDMISEFQLTPDPL